METEEAAQAAASLPNAGSLDAAQILTSLHMTYFRTAFNLGYEQAQKEALSAPGSHKCNCSERRERNRIAAAASRALKRQREEGGAKSDEQ